MYWDSEWELRWDTVRCLALFFCLYIPLSAYDIELLTPGCCSVSQLQHNFKFSSVFYPLHRSGIMYISAVHWNTNELTWQAENDQHPVTNKTSADFRNTHQPSVVGRLMPKSPTQTVCALMSYNRCFYSNNPPLSVCDVHWSQWRSLEGRSIVPTPQTQTVLLFQSCDT